MCSPIKIAYLAIQTNQIDEMVQYYCEKLSFEELIYENNMVFLGNKQTGKISIVLEYEDQEDLKVNCPLKSFHFNLNNELMFNEIKEDNSFIQINDNTIKLSDPDNNSIYLSLVQNDISDQGILLSNINIEGSNVPGEVNLLQQLINCNLKVEDNHYYLLSKNNNCFLQLDLNKKITNYSTCLDYIVFNIANEQCLLKIKDQLSELGYKYYYNKGKNILEFVGYLDISYWFEVDGHYV